MPQWKIMRLSMDEEKSVTPGPLGVVIQPYQGQTSYRYGDVGEYDPLDVEKSWHVPQPEPWVKGRSDDGAIRYKQLE